METFWCWSPSATRHHFVTKSVWQLPSMCDLKLFFFLLWLVYLVDTDCRKEGQHPWRRLKTWSQLTHKSEWTPSLYRTMRDEDNQIIRLTDAGRWCERLCESRVDGNGRCCCWHVTEADRRVRALWMAVRTIEMIRTKPTIAPMT